MISEIEPTVQTMKATEVRQQWSRLLNEVFRHNSRVIVERSGIPVAAIISTSELERFMYLDAQREEHFKALDATREAFKDVPYDEIEREVAKALAEVRAENRQRREQGMATA